MKTTQELNHLQIIKPIFHSQTKAVENGDETIMTSIRNQCQTNWKTLEKGKFKAKLTIASREQPQLKLNKRGVLGEELIMKISWRRACSLGGLWLTPSFLMSTTVNLQIFMKKIANRYSSQPSLGRSQRIISLSTTQKPRPKQTLLLLPKLLKSRPQKLNEDEIERTRERVLKLQRMRYGPIGCSKSNNLQKILLRKKLNKKNRLYSDKSAYLKFLEDSSEGISYCTPEIYVSQLHFIQ